MAGDFEYIVEYHPNHGGDDHFDGNHYHVLKKAFKPKKNKNVKFRLPNYDPDTPCVRVNIHNQKHLHQETYFQQKIIKKVKI